MTYYIFHSEKGKATCDKCKSFDRKRFDDIKDIPELPLHPNCRCFLETVAESLKNNNQKCDCLSKIKILQDTLENVILNLKSFQEKIAPQSSDLEIEKDEIKDVLTMYNIQKNSYEEELGKHLPKCKNYSENLYKEIIKSLTDFKKIDEEASNTGNRLINLNKEIKALEKNSNDILFDVNSIKDLGNEFPHTIDECKINKDVDKLIEKAKKIPEKVNVCTDILSGTKKKTEEIEKVIKTSRDYLDILGEKKKSSCGCAILINPKKDDTKTRVENHSSSKDKNQVKAKNDNKKDIQLNIESSKIQEIVKKNTHFSDKTLDRTKEFIFEGEGFRSKAYEDTNGILTIGYGHTGDVKPGDVITREEAEKLYRKDFEKNCYIIKEVKIPLTENQKIALASLVYNIGPGAFKSSTLLKKLNSGDIQGAANQFDVWIRDGNKIQQGLINRRAREKKLFLTPD